MRLKVNDTLEFNLTLDLNIDYEAEQIDIIVRFWDKKNHKTDAWGFDGNHLNLALAKYNELEKTYFGS